jgi:hypothetical protein
VHILISIHRILSFSRFSLVIYSKSSIPGHKRVWTLGFDCGLYLKLIGVDEHTMYGDAVL